MLYKNVFESALADISGDDIDVMILGDEFDAAFDRKAVAYTIMSYEELLANARDRYRDLYERLAPDGIPPSTTVGGAEDMDDGGNGSTSQDAATQAGVAAAKTVAKKPRASTEA